MSSENDSSVSSSFNMLNCFSNPLFLAPFDNANTPLVSVLFNGDNFLGWSKNVKRALGAKNKLGFIEGFVKKPESTETTYQQWIRCDYMVIGWILSSMKPEVAENFSLVSSAEQLWTEIEERFGQTNGPQIYQVKKELNDLRQQNLTVLMYFNKMKHLWDKMKELRSMPECTCGVLSKCTCDFLRRLADFEEEDQVMQFLLGLNSGFDNAITNVLSMSPLPNLNRTFSIVQQVEKQKEISGLADQGVEVSDLAAQRYKPPHMRGGSGNSRTAEFQNNQSGRKDWRKEKMEKHNKTCDYCKDKGHTMDSCFKLHGYSDWYIAVKGGAKPSSGGDSQYLRHSSKFYMVEKISLFCFL